MTVTENEPDLIDNHAVPLGVDGSNLHPREAHLRFHAGLHGNQRDTGIVALNL
jgi:hypothetical protein